MIFLSFIMAKSLKKRHLQPYEIEFNTIKRLYYVSMTFYSVIIAKVNVNRNSHTRTVKDKPSYKI